MGEGRLASNYEMEFGDLCATVGAVPSCDDAEVVKWKTIANGD